MDIVYQMFNLKFKILRDLQYEGNNLKTVKQGMRDDQGPYPVEFVKIRSHDDALEADRDHPERPLVKMHKAPTYRYQ